MGTSRFVWLKLHDFCVLEWNEGSNSYAPSPPDCGMLKRPYFHLRTPSFFNFHQTNLLVPMSKHSTPCNSGRNCWLKWRCGTCCCPGWRSKLNVKWLKTRQNICFWYEGITNITIDQTNKNRLVLIVVLQTIHRFSQSVFIITAKAPTRKGLHDCENRLLSMDCLQL